MNSMLLRIHLVHISRRGIVYYCCNLLVKSLLTIRDVNFHIHSRWPCGINVEDGVVLPQLRVTHSFDQFRVAHSFNRTQSLSEVVVCHILVSDVVVFILILIWIVFCVGFILFPCGRYVVFPFRCVAGVEEHG